MEQKEQQDEELGYDAVVVDRVVEEVNQLLVKEGWTPSLTTGKASQWHKKMDKPVEANSDEHQFYYTLWVNLDCAGRRIKIQPSVYSLVRTTWVRYNKYGDFSEVLFMLRLKQTEEKMKGSE